MVGSRTALLSRSFRVIFAVVLMAVGGMMLLKAGGCSD